MLVEKGDVSTAVSLFLHAAEQDNPYALFNLGVVYEYGLCVPKNMNQALPWYQKAAQQGSIMAKAILVMEGDAMDVMGNFCFEDMHSYISVPGRE